MAKPLRLPLTSLAHRVSENALGRLPLARTTLVEPLLLRFGAVEAWVTESRLVDVLARLGIPRSFSTAIVLAYSGLQGRRLAIREPKLFAVAVTSAWPLARTLDELADESRPVDRRISAYWALFASLHILERVRVRLGDVATDRPLAASRIVQLMRERLPRIMPLSKHRFPEPTPLQQARAISAGKRKNVLEAALGKRWRTIRTVCLLWAMANAFGNATIIVDWILQPLRTLRRLRSDASAHGRRREVRIVTVDDTVPPTVEPLALPTPAPSSPAPLHLELDSSPSTPRRPEPSPLERTTSSLQLDDGWTTEEDVTVRKRLFFSN